MTAGKRARFLRVWTTNLLPSATAITLSTLAACGGVIATTAQPNDVPAVQPAQNDNLPKAKPVVDADPSSVEFQ